MNFVFIVFRVAYIPNDTITYIYIKIKEKQNKTKQYETISW